MVDHINPYGLGNAGIMLALSTPGIFFFITFIYTDKVLALKSTSLHSLPVFGTHIHSDVISVHLDNIYL